MKDVPAVCGGTPLFERDAAERLSAWPPADPEIGEAMQRAFADGSWGRYRGVHSDRLAKAIGRALERTLVRLCSSGTIAVELALRGLGVGPGDEVILGAYDFPGNFRAVEAIGATPVLVDLDETSFGIDVAQLECACGPKSKAVIASHLHGASPDMPRLLDVAQTLGLGVVEDACQAIGGIIDGRPAGGWGDVGVLSFGGSKLLTAGRGGAVVSARSDVMQRIKVFSERGNDAFPMSELQAAVLLPQFASSPERHRRRLAAARQLGRLLEGCRDLRPVACGRTNCDPAYYKLGIWFARDEPTSLERDVFLSAVELEGIPLHAGFRGFIGRGAQRCRRIGELPTAGSAARRMMVLHHTTLLESNDTVERVGVRLRSIVEALTSGRVSRNLAPPGSASVPRPERFDEL